MKDDRQIREGTLVGSKIDGRRFGGTKEANLIVSSSNPMSTALSINPKRNLQKLQSFGQEMERDF